MQVFLVSIGIPHIGQHEWTAWGDPIRVVVLGAASEEEAIRKVRPHLPPEDPKVKEELFIQDKRTEYFDIKAIELKEVDGVVPLPHHHSF